MVPTRELCVQVAKDLADAGSHLGVRVVAIYGGRAYEPQIAALRKGVDIVVGTPGRLLDLAEQRHLALGRVNALVLDEADEMLDLGLPARRRAHPADAARAAADDAVLGHHARPDHRAGPGVPEPARRTSAPRSPTQGSIHERTSQLVYRAHAMDKVELLARVLQAEGRGLTMIFTRTKRTAQRVADDLAERGFAAAAVHGDLGQGAREQALRAFRSGKVDVLVATDVAARGIDVIDVTHVINYQCPEDEKTYVHRIGRTGRAGKEGVAITLVDWDDMPRWKLISDELGLDIDEPVETYSTSPHLYTDLGIPTSATGRLPLAKRTRAGPRRRVRRQRGRRRHRPQARSHPHRRGARRARHAGAHPQAAQPHPGRPRRDPGRGIGRADRTHHRRTHHRARSRHGRRQAAAAPSPRRGPAPWPGPVGRRHQHAGRRRELSGDERPTRHLRTAPHRSRAAAAR